MCLVNWATTESGTAAAFGIYAVAYSFGPTVIIDSIRTSMWHQGVFGSAYSCKITMNNALVLPSIFLSPCEDSTRTNAPFDRMNIIVRVITGVLQDASPKSSPYEKVTIVYVVLSVLSLVISVLLITLFTLSKFSKGKFKNIYVDIGQLQWTRKQRLANGEMIVARKKVVGGSKSDDGVEAGAGINGGNDEGRLMRKISMGCFSGLMLLVLGSWTAYFWGVATGNN